VKYRSDLFIGSASLSIAFLLHSVVLLVLEPAMGFTEFSDFFDLDKIIPALGSAGWMIGNFMHVLAGMGLLFLASGVRSAGISRSSVTAGFGLAAAPLFVIVGMSGFVGRQLLGLLTDPGERDAALLGMILGSRTMVLYAAIALMGGMMLLLSAQIGLIPRWFRIYGIFAGAAALAFPFIPTPIPLIFLVWFAGFVFSHKAP
jgi:hypothetical protein